MLKLIEIEGFRCIEKDETNLNKLTVFYGPMGSGKTSKLLAILFALTGSARSGMTLDELINVNSERMKVRIVGEYDGEKFEVVRSKRPRSSTQTKGKAPFEVSERIYVEGREIARIFLGTAGQRTLSLYDLFGLTKYVEIASEITPSPIERRIRELKEELEKSKKFKDVSLKLEEAQIRLSDAKDRLNEIEAQIEKNKELFEWAESILRKAKDIERIKNELESKKKLIAEYKEELENIPPYPEGIEEELNELESRYKGFQRRIAYIEALMQILRLEDRDVESIRECPLCKAPISPQTLEEFKGVIDEYGQIVPRASELEMILSEKRKQYEKAKRNKERANFLQSEILRLEASISGLETEVINEEDMQRASNIISRREALERERRELGFRIRSLQNEIDAYKIVKPSEEISEEDVIKRIERLKELADRLRRIKASILEAIKNVREEQLLRLRESFKEAFKKIYPYETFTSVNFDTETVRGREVITIKAKTDSKWITARQMSTGENVAISFALLYALNRLEKEPILLLDEPEEGLDDEGVKGLAEVLNKLSETTQIIVATRSKQLAELLIPETLSTL
jgi:DNA repair exonuclease SbcCD ATPase subunit